jgi:hypothetical protein
MNVRPKQKGGEAERFSPLSNEFRGSVWLDYGKLSFVCMLFPYSSVCTQCNTHTVATCATVAERICAPL